MDKLLRLRATYGRILEFCSLIAGIILFAVMLMVVANALLRYGFNAPIAGTLELTEGALPLIIFLSLAATQHIGGHIKVELLTRRFSPHFKRAALVLAFLAGAAFFAWATYAGWNLATKSWAIGEIERGSIRYPLWPVKGCIALGMAMITLQFLLDGLITLLGGQIPQHIEEQTS